MKVLLCGTNFPEASHRLRPCLSEAGHELIVCPENDIPKYSGQADVIIPIIAKIDADILAKGQFGLVQQYGVGLEGVDIEAATRHGVWVARAPSDVSGNAASVAEHALLLMLMLSRHMAAAGQALANRLVGQPSGLALLGKTACIVGLGNIGVAMATRLSAFGMRILAVDDRPPRNLPPQVMIERRFPFADSPQALGQADYIILCLNYKPSLRNLFSHELLAAAKPGAYLVNVARGGLVDPEALLLALQSGSIAGAGLDVFWEEPVDPGHPLFRQNVVATPHVAGVTDVSYAGIARICAENISRYARGEVPLHTVNRPENPRR